MNKYLDYIAYKKENIDFLDLLEKNECESYQSLKDVIYILDKISEKMDTEFIDEEIDYIFDFGFDYFYGDMEFLKNIYKDRLKNDFFLFKKYDPLIRYGLLIYQIIDDLEEQKKLTKRAKDQLQNRTNSILSMIDNREVVTDELLKDIDLEITGIIPKGYNYNTVAKIFEDIAIEVELWN